MKPHLLTHSGHSLSSDPLTAKGTYVQFPIEDILNDIASRHPLCAFMTHVLNARLQRDLLCYDKAADYWQKAVTLLPEENKREQAYCLKEASDDLSSLGKDTEALSLFKQGFTLFREAGGRTAPPPNRFITLTIPYSPQNHTMELLNSTPTPAEEVFTHTIASITPIRGSLPPNVEEVIENDPDVVAEAVLNDIATRRPQWAVTAHVLNARLQRDLHHSVTAATYWQKAAALLLADEDRKERAYCLREAGYDLFRLGRYNEALSLFEQGLTLFIEAGGKAGEETIRPAITLLHQVLKQVNNPED